MAEKRRQEEAKEDLISKRHCVENSDSLNNLNGEEGHGDEEVLDGLPPSWGSQASSSESSGSSSSGHQPGADSSSEGSITDSLDMGLGDIQPDSLAGPMGWLQKQMMSGTNPRSILMRIIPSGMTIPDDMDEFEMWSIIAEYLRSIDEPPPRQKLEQYNTFDDAIQLLNSCKNILVLTGAGVSVSCGIPDFRSRDGVYARLAVDFPDLPDPQAMFEISYFRKDPRPFYKFAKELFPGQFKPSPSHKFISQLEQHDKLLRNYTQNIDTLEQCAGITRVIQCHGSFATATCTRCGLRVDSDAIREDVFNQVVPVCPQCGPDTPEMAVLKPDIVFFGEGLPNHFYDKLNDDKEAADLLIVMGSSLKVRPVATIPSLLPKDVPQILINREPLHHLNFDIELLGDCDVIINEILHRLGDGWNHVCQSQQRLTETTDIPNIPKPNKEVHTLLDKSGSTVEEKPNVTSALVNEESESKPVVVKSEDDSEKSVSSFKEEGQVSGGDDKVEGSDVGEDDRYASSNSQKSPILPGENVKQSCDDRPHSVDDQSSAEHRNGFTNECKLHTDPMPHSQSKSGDSSSSLTDRLQGTDEDGNALVSSEPQTCKTGSTDSSLAQTAQGKTVQSDSAAEAYMLFQRTLDSIGNSSKDAGTIDVKGSSDQVIKHEPGSSESLDDGDWKEPSSDVKTGAVGLGIDDSDRTKSQDTKDDSASEAAANDGSSSETPVNQKEDTSLAQDSETKPSPSTSAATKAPRETIATHLKESTYLFIPPMRYVFHGAEVYLDEDDDDLEGLHNDMGMDDLHNDLENGDFHTDFHSDLHNGDELPDLLDEDHVSAKEKAVSIDDLTPTVPLTNKEPGHCVFSHSISKEQFLLQSNGRDGSPFEAPTAESAYTNIGFPETP
ncbi:NAD-dependent protein deacetylase sirtuin-1-like isoform X1 [Lytechinus variegatus]|uniref:NAD-dependent protein deacetylase sirtuin-1-like isoform X1 n=2 Tax=Lytechinus variegatus TaxID=7654 RepID=UPI001BB2740E|nr:NAD-dependent protein deacetylase sirtuin-1-like isoform X1 [Lytechinus variegatus]